MRAQQPRPNRIAFQKLLISPFLAINVLEIQLLNIVQFCAVLRIFGSESWLLASARFCPTVQALQGPYAQATIFDTTKIKLRIHYFVSSFHQR